MRTEIEPRQQRGLEIAATAKIIKKGNAWSVPSQSGKGRYKVRALQGDLFHCNCPDHETDGGKCKHIFAVEFSRQRDNRRAQQTAPKERPAPAPRKTYPQDWRAYNIAQTTEKERFLELLHDLCGGIVEAVPQTMGRPRLPIRDAVFAACFKVYSTVSCRRFMTDLRGAYGKGLISKIPHFNTIFNYLENGDLTPILRAMITETSLPLKAVECDFAADSSGFTTSRFVRWFDHKYGAPRQQHEWVKVHLMCGVRTNIVTAVEIPALIDQPTTRRENRSITAAT